MSAAQDPERLAEEAAASIAPSSRLPRIEYLSHGLIPSQQANSIQIMRMCEEFARRGHEVILHCRLGCEPGSALSHYGVETPFGLRGEVLPRIPILTRLVHTIRSINRVGAAAGPRVLYGRDAYLLGAMAILGRLDSPAILEVHQPPSGRVESVLQRKLFEHPRFLGLVTITAALRDRYLEQFPGLLDHRILVAPDGASDLGDPSEADDRIGGRLAVGYVGSLSKGKGAELIAAVAARLPDCDFHVVGGKADEVARWRSASSLSNLQFHGFIAPDIARREWSRFDIALAPYGNRVHVGRKEVDVGAWMSPLKIFEAMAAGRAIVAADLPVLREVLRDGDNALLAAPGDTDAWVACLERLVRDPALRARLGRAAREDLVERYTWARRATRVLEPMVNA